MAGRWRWCPSDDTVYDRISSSSRRRTVRCRTRSGRSDSWVCLVSPAALLCCSVCWCGWWRRWGARALERGRSSWWAGWSASSSRSRSCRPGRRFRPKGPDPDCPAHRGTVERRSQQIVLRWTDPAGSAWSENSWAPQVWRQTAGPEQSYSERGNKAGSYNNTSLNSLH